MNEGRHALSIGTSLKDFGKKLFAFSKIAINPVNLPLQMKVKI